MRQLAMLALKTVLVTLIVTSLFWVTLNLLDIQLSCTEFDAFALEESQTNPNFRKQWCYLEMEWPVGDTFEDRIKKALDDGLKTSTAP